MKISQETKDQIVDNIKSGHPYGFKSFLSVPEDSIRHALENYIDLPFNVFYNPPGIFQKEFFDYFISVATHQVNSAVHPLTCGADSNHELLVPRVDHQGRGYLICPTCGYVQPNFP